MKFLTNIFASISKVAVKVTLAVVVMFAETFFIRAQESAERIYYRFDNATVDASYLSNSQAFANIDDLLSSGNFEAYEIVSYSSPEGNYDYNFSLSTRRANALLKYLVGRYPQIAGKVSVKPAAEAWEALRSAVVSDTRLSESAKASMLQIIDSNDSADTMERKLGALESYRYLYTNYFRTLRYAEIRFSDGSESEKEVSRKVSSVSDAILFELDSTVLDRNFGSNAQVLDNIATILDGRSADEIESIVIVASTAPDSTAAVNDLCAQQRGQAVYDYIVAKHPELAGKITVRSTGAAWQDLRNAVEADTTMAAESKAEVLSIIDSFASDEEKEAELRSLSVWNHLSEDIFPEMRSARVTINTGVAGEKAEKIEKAEKASETAASKNAVRFALNSVDVDRDFSNNAEVLDDLAALIESRSADEIESIDVFAKTSPDGPVYVNNRCAKQRGQAVKDYIESKYPELSGKITVHSAGEAWEDLRVAVESDTALSESSRSKILSIIVSPVADDEKEAKLRELPEWEHLFEDVFPGLRCASAEVKFKETAPTEPDAPVAEPAEITVEDEKLVVDETLKVEDTTRLNLPLMPYKKTVIAVKTNLLYDLATALNFEVEIPIGKRWSLVAEDVFPWWETGNKYCFQMWEMGLETRYWLEPWKVVGKEKLRGWFTGIYGMSAKYDFQWDRTINYQGEYWSAGITAGYSKPLGRKKWGNLEMSVGLGYLESNYRHYYPADDYGRLYRDRANDGRLVWFGPTKAKVSLVIPINIPVKKEVRYE